MHAAAVEGYGVVNWKNLEFIALHPSTAASHVKHSSSE